jgi:hypothetical protein
MNMNKGFISHIPFFKSLDPLLLINLVVCLQPLKVDHGEVIYRRKDRAEHSEILY